MKRRDVLRTLGGFGSMNLLGMTKHLGKSAFASETVDSALAFSSSFVNFKEQYEPIHLRFDRPLPAGLAGTLYRNGPALMERAGLHYHHWFDGDGMIQSFHLSISRIKHHRKV